MLPLSPINPADSLEPLYKVSKLFERISRLSDDQGGIEINKSKAISMKDEKGNDLKVSFDRISDLYIRECYVKLLAKILDMFTNGVEASGLNMMIPAKGIILAGSTGVGKTVFSFIFMSHLIKTRQSFLYKPNKASQIYFFDGSCFYSRQSTISSFAKYKPKYCILDCQLVDDVLIDSKTLVITTDEKELYRNFERGSDVHKLYMPYWKWSEFEDLFSQRPDCYDAKKSREFFDIYGGNFRYVVHKPRFETVDRLRFEMQSLIQYFSLARLFSPRHLESNDMIMKVLHFQVDDDDFACNSVRFASHFVLNYVARTKESELRGIQVLSDNTFYRPLLVDIYCEVESLKEAAEKTEFPSTNE